MSTTALAKWGNSIGVRIPADILKELGVKEGNQIEIKTEKGSIILKPVSVTHRKNEVDLASLLGDTDCHYKLEGEDQVWETASPKGAEIW